MAACLPTLKPLAAGFFGAVSALTSGERYGSRYASGPNSRPLPSNGYLKQDERSGANNSYAMDDLKDSRSGSAPDSLEEERKEQNATYISHKRRASRSAESEDSILPRHKGIMRTTEVEVKNMDV